MMIRILSVLPAAIGVICALLVVVSLFGLTLEPTRTSIPLVPCTDDNTGCPVGMSVEDLSVPTAFILLDIDLTIEWKEYDKSWLGIISSPPPSGCEPDSNGLTTCTADDFDFIAGGDEELDGSLEFNLKPGDYKFVTGSTDTSGFGGEQLVTTTTEMGLNPIAELLLGVVSILLLAGSGEMFVHEKILGAWKRFRDG
jgi:hypothetical protein